MTDLNHYDTAPGRNFCSHCGAKLDANAYFCSTCGAKQEATAIQETEILTTSAPVHNPAPVVVATPTSAICFPIAPIIFASIAVVYYLTTLFSDNYAPHNFIYKLLYFIPYVLMMLGLILCKKQKNVLFGLAFLVMGGVDLLFWLYNTFTYGRYYGNTQLVFDILFYLPQLIFTAMIGIPYLTANPSAKRAKNAFAVWIIVLSFHVLVLNCARYIDFSHYDWYTKFFLDFALLTVPTMIAALTYTPFDCE